MQIDIQPVTLTDPHDVADIFATGLGEVQDAGGGCLRYTLYSQQGGLFVVVARIVVPAQAIPAILFIAGKSVGLSIVKAMSGGPVH